MAKERLLFIDLLKVIGIVLVIWEHVIVTYHWNGLISFVIPKVIFLDQGIIGVAIFIFASGASLAYSTKVNNISDVNKFYTKRLLRIYPAYWAAVVLCIALSGTTLQFKFKEYIELITGFQAYMGDFNGPVNYSFWFIGLILCLYFLYPILDYLFKRKPHLTIISLFFISLFSRIIFNEYNNFGLDRPAEWFPLCRIFEFGLGIYLIKIDLYAHVVNRSVLIQWLSNLSFYMYLIHVPLIKYLEYNPLLFTTMLLLLASMLHSFDMQIKKFDPAQVIEP